MKIRSREELVEHLLPYVCEIPREQFRPWLAHDAHYHYVPRIMDNIIHILEDEGRIYVQNDISNCILSITSNGLTFWPEGMFLFLIMNQQRRWTGSQLLNIGMNKHARSFVRLIWHHSKLLNIDLTSDEHTFDFIRESLNSDCIEFLLDYLPNVKLGESRQWDVLIRFILDYMAKNPFAHVPKLFLDKLIPFVDIFGDGIQLLGPFRSDIIPYGVTLSKRYSQQKTYRTQQMECMRIALLSMTEVSRDLIGIIVSFYQQTDVDAEAESKSKSDSGKQIRHTNNTSGDNEHGSAGVK